MSSANANHSDHSVAEKHYWIAFVVLGIVTAVEVAWSYIGVEGNAFLLPLLGMMAFKFGLVAAIFMHLYFDKHHPNGKLFTYIFAFGIVLASVLFLIVFAAFEFEI